METELRVKALLLREGLIKKHTPEISVGRAIPMAIVTLMIEVVEHWWVILQAIYPRVLSDGKCNL